MIDCTSLLNDANTLSRHPVVVDEGPYSKVPFLLHFKADKEEGYSYFHTFHILYFAMIQPPEPGQSTRQPTLPFAIPSIIMDGGGQYPPFFDVCS